MATELKRVSFNGANGSHFYLKLTYDLLSQSIENNTSTIRYYEYVGSKDNYSGYGQSGSGDINGSWVGGTGSVGVNSEVYIGYLDQTVTHNTDGTCTVSYSASYSFPWNNLTNASLSGTLTLKTIPRYFSKDPEVTLDKNNEVSFNCSWTTSENCNRIRYSLDNGSNWITASTTSAKTGNFNITSLAADTTYNIKFEFKKADSGLTSTMSAQQTTYAYPYIIAISPAANSVWNMSGDTQSTSITLYNPLRRSVRGYISINSTAGTRVATISATTGTSLTASLSKSTINNTVTTAQSATLVYWCQYSTDGTNYITSNTTLSNSYQLRSADCAPSFSSLTYIDGDSNIRSVIGASSNILVQNYSIVRATASTPTYKYGASFKSLSITLGSKTVSAEMGTAVDLGKFNYSSAQTMTAILTDSRGFTYTRTTTVNFIAYQPPQVSVKAQRTGGYGTNATFTVSASYTSLKVGGSEKNAWLNSNTAYVRYAISPTPSTPSASGNLSNANPISNLITNITGANNNLTYTITIYANDKITSATASATFGQGQHILSILEDIQAVGVNATPGTTEAPGLYVNGVSKLTGNTTVTGTFSSSEQIKTTSTTASSSISTGSIVTSGGIGVAKNSYFGENLNVAGTLTVGSKTLLNWIYPIGSIYISTVSTSPETLFGGTWVQIKDTFLLTAGDTYSAGNTGGEATHALTANEIPEFSFATAHIGWADDMYRGLKNVTQEMNYDGPTSGYNDSGQNTNLQDHCQHIYTFGGDGAHNNMPPYLVVYAWKRTA